MAWKEDTFWEKHPQPTSPPDCWHWKPAPRVRQGLRLKPRFEITSEMLSIHFLVLIMLLHFAPELFDPWFYIATFPAFIVAWWTFFNNLIPSALSRYYIFDDVTMVLVSRNPVHRFTVLTRIASDPQLIEHLGESDWRKTPGDLIWSALYGKLTILLSSGLVVLGMLAALVEGVNINWLFNMTILVATTILLVRKHNHIAPSRPRSDYEHWEAPPDDSDRVPYERVRTATLHWDRLLQREYLLLECDGGPMRYYNFTGDPLYLLRLWKQRMPGSVLTVDNCAAGTS